jgi:Trk-type K+ transport system membrane component
MASGFGFLDAFFEIVSAFTTTDLSITETLLKI